MRDGRQISNGLEFDAWRHLGQKDTVGLNHLSRRRAKTQPLLTDFNAIGGDSTMIWGLSRITCPERFYAVLMMKLVVDIFLEEYNVTRLEIEGERSF